MRDTSDTGGGTPGLPVSKARRRYVRTIVLGILAMAALLYGIVDNFEVSSATLRQFFLATLGVITLMILAAGAAAALWVKLRKSLRRD